MISSAQVLKSLGLKKNPDDHGETLECSICDNSSSSFVIMQNGDVECGYCGDKKANLTLIHTKPTGSHS